ncbi:MAG: hypothetical protein KIS96_02620 [Bauldia sp.]|nr:hypothetical protein [Bauldia sp.]
MLYVVTGVASSADDIFGDLAFQLGSDSSQFLFWIDFKDPSLVGHLRHAVLGTRSVVCIAPSAVWGGSSVARSMIAALGYAVEKMSGWDHLMFLSMADIPLVPTHELEDWVDATRSVDFLGHRWNNWSNEAYKPGHHIIGEPFETYEYRLVSPRPGVNVMVAHEVAGKFTDPLIRELRLCNELFERYSVTCTDEIGTDRIYIYPLSPHVAALRDDFVARFGWLAGRMWVRLSRRAVESLLSLPISAFLNEVFATVLIADECLFQTAMLVLEKTGSGPLEIAWTGYHFNDGTVIDVHPGNFRGILAARRPHDFFVRKRRRGDRELPAMVNELVGRRAAG